MNKGGADVVARFALHRTTSASHAIPTVDLGAAVLGVSRTVVGAEAPCGGCGSGAGREDGGGGGRTGQEGPNPRWHERMSEGRANIGGTGCIRPAKPMDQRSRTAPLKGPSA